MRLFVGLIPGLRKGVRIPWDVSAMITELSDYVLKWVEGGPMIPVRGLKWLVRFDAAVTFSLQGNSASIELDGKMSLLAKLIRFALPPLTKQYKIRDYKLNSLTLDGEGDPAESTIVVDPVKKTDTWRVYLPGLFHTRMFAEKTVTPGSS